MFGLIPWWVKALAVVALVIGLLAYKTHYDNGLREEGRQEVITKYRARVAQQVLDYGVAVDRATAAEKDRDAALQAKHDADNALAISVAHADVSVPNDLARVLNGLASGGRSDAPAPTASSEAVPTVPAATVYDANDIARWRVQVEQAYDSVNADDLMCRERYDAARAVQAHTPQQ